MANTKRYRGLTREQQAQRNSRAADSPIRSLADSGAGENYAKGIMATKRGRAPYYERRKRYQQVRAALGLSAG